MPRVFDCFQFYNEFDVLEIRLAELDPLVDHFVIVEATHTHTGKPKPLLLHRKPQALRALRPQDHPCRRR